MKCLIFSDSHGDITSLDRAIRTHRDAEVIFFLGDGLSDLDALTLPKNMMVLAVRGNCDFSGVFAGSLVRKVEKITLMGKTIVLTHGDLYGAKYGEGGLLRLAIEEGADLVLFGHTHIPVESFRYVLDSSTLSRADAPLVSEDAPQSAPDAILQNAVERVLTEETPYTPEERPVTLFNPGSIGSASHTYGILTITETTYLFSHAHA